MHPDPQPDDPTPGMHIWGWMQPPELEWLMGQAATMGSVAEVGVLRGRSAFALLTACPGPVYCVDCWSDRGDHAYTGFMEACGHFENVRPVRGCSPEAAELVPSVDMTFIDADHVYASIAADIAAWLPKTSRLLCGHDYADVPAAWDTDGVNGVWKAAHEAFGDRVYNPEGTSIWAVDL
jgi:hypothetical protein